VTLFFPITGVFSENEEVGVEVAQPFSKKSFTLSPYMTKLRGKSRDMTFQENVGKNLYKFD
jgi:hypothetical protein